MTEMNQTSTKKFMYVFVVTHTASSDKLEPVVHYFFDERNTPMVSHLYYKMRRRAFGMMDEKYWTCSIKVFRTEDPRYFGNFPLAIATVCGSMEGFKYVGYFDLTLYNYRTCRGALTHVGHTLHSCWNWNEHDTARDWANHTVHNDYIRPWRY